MPRGWLQLRREGCNQGLWSSLSHSLRESFSLGLWGSVGFYRDSFSSCRDRISCGLGSSFSFDGDSSTFSSKAAGIRDLDAGVTAADVALAAGAEWGACSTSFSNHCLTPHCCNSLHWVLPFGCWAICGFFLDLRWLSFLGLRRHIPLFLKLMDRLGQQNWLRWSPMSQCCQRAGRSRARKNLRTNRRSWGKEHTRGGNGVCVAEPGEAPEPPVPGHICPHTAQEKPGGAVGLGQAGSGETTVGFLWGGVWGRNPVFQRAASWKVQEKLNPALAWAEAAAAAGRGTDLVRWEICCAKTEIAWAHLAVLTKSSFNVLLHCLHWSSLKTWFYIAPSISARSIMPGSFCFGCCIEDPNGDTRLLRGKKTTLLSGVEKGGKLKSVQWIKNSNCSEAQKPETLTIHTHKRGPANWTLTLYKTSTPESA